MIDRPPNVLLITLDQWRFDCLAAVGHPLLKTPNIDELARDGTLFSNHFTVASPCGPARASLLTGLYLHHHGSLRNGIPLDSRCLTVAQLAAAVGYRPLLFGFTDTTLPGPFQHATRGPGMAVSMAPGFEEGLHLPGDGWPWVEWLHKRGYSLPDNPRDMWLPARKRDRIDDSPTVYRSNESETAFLTDAFCDWLEDSKKPWFAHVSYFRPHHPYIAPEPYNRAYRSGEAERAVRCANREIEGRQHPWLDAQIKRQSNGKAPVQDEIPMASVGDAETLQLRALYYGTIAECDDAVGRLVAALKQKGDYEDTLIILTSDHGDMLGDHWLWAAEGYFDQAFRIPLIIKMPGRRNQCATVDALTESVDILPTILELIRAPNASCDGRSLLPLMMNRRPKDWRSHVHWQFDFRDEPTPALQAVLGLDADQANLSVVRGKEWKYVRFAGLEPLLFDLNSDPMEFNDRSRDPSAATIRQTLDKKIEKFLAT